MKKIINFIKQLLCMHINKTDTYKENGEYIEHELVCVGCKKVFLRTKFKKTFDANDYIKSQI